MKKIILGIILFIFYNTSYACMPFSPTEIFIGTYNGKEDRIHPDENFRQAKNVEFIKISNTKKPFGESYKKLGKYYFLHSDNNDVNFDLKNYKKGDQIIMISNYNDGNYEDYFAVYELGKLVRKSNGELDIIDMQGAKKNWGKTLWQCGNYKPNGVMDKNKLLSELAYFVDVGAPIYEEKKSIYFIIIFGIFGFLTLLIFLIFKNRK